MNVAKKELLIAREKALHDHKVRADKSQLTNLLHPSFKEVGYSGRTYDFNSIVGLLQSQDSNSNTIHAQNFECFFLEAAVCLIHYNTATVDKDGAATRHASRTSVWLFNGDQWQMRFHQGTPCEQFALDTDYKTNQQ